MKGNKYECSCQYKLVPMEVSSGWAPPVVRRGRGAAHSGGLCALRMQIQRIQKRGAPTRTSGQRDRRESRFFLACFSKSTKSVDFAVDFDGIYVGMGVVMRVFCAVMRRGRV